jgi:putative ABC transport system permease protein
VTYSARARPATREVTEGEWWPEDTPARPLISFAAEEAAEIGLELGDEMTVNILGRDITATIASFPRGGFLDRGHRLHPVDEPGRAAGAPHTHIATIYAEPEAEAALLRDIWGPIPTSPRSGARRHRPGDEVLAGVAAATTYGALGDADDRLRGADRRGGGGRAGAHLRGGGAEDARRGAAAVLAEFRAALGAVSGGGGRSRSSPAGSAGWA